MNGYLLIGGRSRRMGQSKVELPFGGSTFLARAVERAREVFDDVYAVQRAGGVAAPGVETLFEAPHDQEAPAFGVLCALQHARARCFVLAVDYPLMTAEILGYLVRRSEDSTASLVAPRWGERLQMLCARYDGAVLAPRLVDRIAAGRLDLRGLAAVVETEVIEEAELRARFAGEALMNVNTPEELQEARKLL